MAYPDVTGLRFTSAHHKSAEWQTRFLVTAPIDEFVLNPLDRISFDLRAHINIEPTLERRWRIELAPGEYDVQYCYTVDPDFERSDFLGKHSRFAAMTRPWGGLVVSNSVQFVVSQPGKTSEQIKGC